ALISEIILQQSTGNTLAYALVALDLSISHGFGWESLSPQMVDKLVELIQSPNPNVKRHGILFIASRFTFISGGLRIGIHVASSKNSGYPALMKAIQKSNLSSRLVMLFKLLLISYSEMKSHSFPSWWKIL